MLLYTWCCSCCSSLIFFCCCLVFQHCTPCNCSHGGLRFSRRHAPRNNAVGPASVIPSVTVLPCCYWPSCCYCCPATWCCCSMPLPLTEPSRPYRCSSAAPIAFAPASRPNISLLPNSFEVGGGRARTASTAYGLGRSIRNFGLSPLPLLGISWCGFNNIIATLVRQRRGWGRGWGQPPYLATFLLQLVRPLRVLAVLNLLELSVIHSWVNCFTSALRVWVLLWFGWWKRLLLTLWNECVVLLC